MEEVLGNQEMPRFPHSHGLLLGRQLFWLAALLT